MLTHLSLFTGIGGLDLAAEWAGFKTVGQCEWADYPTKVLEKHWPDVPRWRDIHELSARDFIQRTGIRPGELTALSGGFPCQPFSVAGNQRGKEDDRYLWPQMLRVISELHPAYIIGENVPGILHIAADDVCEDLEREGYEVGIFDYEAAAVGAPHRRERFLFVAHARCSLRQGIIQQGKHEAENSSRDAYKTQQSCCSSEFLAYTYGDRSLQGKSKERSTESRFKAFARSSVSGENVAYTNNTGLQGWERESVQECTGERLTRQSGTHVSHSEMRGKQFEQPGRGETRRSGSGGWWSVEPNVGRVANGVPSRVDRLKCLGNAVVPYQAYPIFKAIADIELMAAEKKGANPCY